MDHRNKITSLGLLVAVAVIGCSSASDGRWCEDYACFNHAQLAGALNVDAHTTQIDVHFCFEQDCRDGLIELTAADGSMYSTWEGGSMVCLAPSAASGVYDVTAWWDHQQAKQPPDGSSYELRLTDHQSNAVLLDQTRTASYVAAPDPDGCHPDCWGAQMSLGDGGGDDGAPPDLTPQARAVP
jgi:hypothetical protein